MFRSQGPAWKGRPFVFPALAAFVAVLLTGCSTPTHERPLQRFQFSSPHMGTLFTITLFGHEPASAQIAAKAAFQRIAALDEIMSDYQADSELMKLCDQPAGTPVPVSADLFDVLEKAQRFSRLTAGAFDVTVGPYVRLWRFARKKKSLPSAAELAHARTVVGFHHLRLDPRHQAVTLMVPGMRLDLGGIAKGYAADAALKTLRAHGFERALVAASGDIAFGDPPPNARGWTTGITTIDDRSNRAERTVLLHNAAISTSGDTEQYIEIDGVRYSHIIDPLTGLGLTNRVQATLIAPDATTTDALATALCILDSQRGLALVDSLPGVSALILKKDGDVIRAYPSRRFKKIPQRLETAKD